MGISDNVGNLSCDSKGFSYSTQLINGVISRPLKEDFEVDFSSFKEYFIILNKWKCLVGFVEVESSWKGLSLRVDFVGDMIGGSELVSIEILWDWIEGELHKGVVEEFIEILPLKVSWVALLWGLAMNLWSWNVLGADVECRNLSKQNDGQKERLRLFYQHDVEGLQDW